jgi:hypothetical protein
VSQKRWFRIRSPASATTTLPTSNDVISSGTSISIAQPTGNRVVSAIPMAHSARFTPIIATYTGIRLGRIPAVSRRPGPQT